MNVAVGGNAIDLTKALAISSIEHLAGTYANRAGSRRAVGVANLLDAFSGERGSGITARVATVASRANGTSFDITISEEF